MKRKTVPSILIVSLLAALLLIPGCKGKSIDKLLDEKKYDAAEKACMDKEGNERKECLEKVATVYQRNSDFKKAAEIFDKAGEPLRATEAYFLGNYVSDAENYCKKQTGNTKLACASLLGNNFYRIGNYQKAITYFQLAGNTEMSDYITGKIPVFQLLELIGQRLSILTNKNLYSKLSNFNDTLKDYIYLNQYFKWPFAIQSPEDKRAAEIREKAIQTMEESLTPLLIEKTLVLVSSPEPLTPGLEWATLYNSGMNGLINMIKNFHTIAGYRKFFTKYSVPFRDIASLNSKNTNPEHDISVSNSFNYEEAYAKALTYAETTLISAQELKKLKDSKQIKGYIEDFTIDRENIHYIAEMLKNLEVRILDIKKRAEYVKKQNSSIVSPNEAEKIYQNFISTGNRVLHAIGKEEYQKANDLLTNEYDLTKMRLKIQ